jgi:hypothetical protein
VRQRPVEHGTVRGYHQHGYTKTTPCRACCAAWSAYGKRQRDRGRCAKGLGWPLEIPATVAP